MTEEEKLQLAYDMAKNGVDLEKVEKLGEDIIKLLKPIMELTLKNKSILDKYFKTKVRE